jgi:hypothetical protein
MDKFLENFRAKPSQEIPLKLLQGTVDHITKLAQLVEGFELEPCETELNEISGSCAARRAKRWLNHL